jgi:hypothetical protein
VRTLAEYFTQLTHLPRLNGAHVLPDCLAKGVQRGLFAYALGDGEQKAFDTIFFSDKSITANDYEVIETAWLVRPALAKTFLPEPKADGGVGTGVRESEASGPGPAASAGTGGREQEAWGGQGGGIVIKGGERRLNRVRIDVRQLPWENWHDIYNEVIQPLADEGAEVSCPVVILARGDAAIRENNVELGIKESLSQRDIEADMQTG